MILDCCCVRCVGIYLDLVNLVEHCESSGTLMIDFFMGSDMMYSHTYISYSHVYCQSHCDILNWVGLGFTLLEVVGVT